MNAFESTISARYAGLLGGFELDLAFDIPMRGITGVFGPSGCGKTSLLRCLAGLNRLPGRLVVGKQVWQDDATSTFRQPHERPIGYVFQEPSLFPHLSVRGNLDYGYRRALKKGAAEEIRMDDVVDLLGIGPLLSRATAALSGGERQRVALGRALLAQPRLLLMDEPLSALDRLAKEAILPYFEVLHASLAIPVLYVTHDLSEIERLADFVLLLDNGRVVFAGALPDVLADSRFPIARAWNASTVFEAWVCDFDASDGLTALEIDGVKLLVPSRIGETGTMHRVQIAATDVSLAASPPSITTILNVVPVRVSDIHELDEAQVNIVVTLGHRNGGTKLLARVTRRAHRIFRFDPGQDVYAQIKAVSLVAQKTSGASVQSRACRPARSLKQPT